MKTKERILDVSLELLNQQGAASVSTNSIADAADLSVGNLYYHFHNKEEIVLALFQQFQQQALELLYDEPRSVQINHYWAWLHLWFELVEQFQFLFQDLTYLLHKNHQLKHEMAIFIQQLLRTLNFVFEGLYDAGELNATRQDRKQLAERTVFLCLYWYDFQQVLVDAGHTVKSFTGQSGMEQGLNQLLPYLTSENQLAVENLIDQYTSRSS